MKKVEIYSTPYCPFCIRAKLLLDSKGVSYSDIDVSALPDKKQEMIERSQRHTVPQIFIDDESIGGCDDLFELDEKNQLDKLLAD